MINEIIGVIFILVLAWIIANIFNTFILPFITRKTMKEIERNPKWIMSKVQGKYYGFSDIDIILAESPLGRLPYFRLSKDKKRLELLISDNISTKDAEEVARIALVGKIKVKYGLFYPDKSIHWLSILCYMLDGGDIKSEDTKWEEKNISKS